MKLLIDSEMVERIRTGGTWYVENLENLPPARFLDLDSIPVKTLLEMWQDDTTAFGTDVVRYSDLTDRVVERNGLNQTNQTFSFILSTKSSTD